MQDIVTTGVNFSHLKHGEQGHIIPSLLSDFKFGNQRGSRSDDKFNDLCESIKRQGVTQPVAVRLNEGDPNTLELIFGHGRRDAAIASSTASVPFIFYEVDDDVAFEMHLAENTVREDLDIVSKAKAAKQYMTKFKGDYEAVASKLTMKVKALRELLELNKCSEKVLEAIRNDHISPSHGILLAPFPAHAQDKNLDKIIAEKWTVQTLKERSGRAKLPLARAKFDTNECETCEFNTIHQRDLLGDVNDKAMCAKVVCFQEKTKAYLEAQKETLTEKYGTILLLSETSELGCQTVSSEIVGEDQFSSCTECDDKVTVMNDKYGKEGELTHDQCTNKVCFTKCKEAHLKSLETSELQEDEKVGSEPVATTESKPIKSKSSKSQKPTLSKSVIKHYDTFLRGVASNHYNNDERFLSCALLASLIDKSGYTDDTISLSSFSDVIVTCLSLNDEARQVLMKKACNHLLYNTNEVGHSRSVDTVLIKCLKADNTTTLPVITQAWQPTKENLSIYTISQLGMLAKSAGLDKKMEEKEKGSFEKLTKKGKSDVIKAIQSVEHDWSEFIPKSLISKVQ